MPTNETLLENGICPNCGWHVAALYDKTGEYQCARCRSFYIEEDFTPLDDLAQEFADLKQLEFDAFLLKVKLCAEATRRGQGVIRNLCGYPGYTPQSVKRLGHLVDLPDHLKDPQLPIGVYWVAIRASTVGDDVDMEKLQGLVEEAIIERYSVRQAKEAWGVEDAERRHPDYEGEADLVEAGELRFTKVGKVKVYMTTREK